jgi:hypothetical protein
MRHAQGDMPASIDAGLKLLLAAVAVVAVAGCAGAVPPVASPASVQPVTTSVPVSSPVSETAAGLSSKPRATRTASSVTLAAFAGSWTGHTRSLTVSASGTAHEVVYDGCCTQEIDMTFRLSNPRGTSAARATATATVTSVAFYALAGPAAKVGQTGTASLVDGVLTVPFSDNTYCDKAAAARSECGA